MNNNNQHCDSSGLVVLGLALIICPAFLGAILVAALLFLLVVEAPRFTGASLVLIGVVGLGIILSGSDPSLSGGDFPLGAFIGLFSTLIAVAGCLLFGWGMRGGMSSMTAVPSSLGAPRLKLAAGPYTTCAPRSDSTGSLDETSVEDQEEGLRAAMEDAKRIAKLTGGGHEARKRVFERVFLRQCQQRGVKVSEFRWRRREHPAEQSPTVEPGDVLCAQE